ncbi:hypothetical protein JFU37_03570 [Pseudomonas sp. TH41]|uniref:hypothetical protein n=1 Tax=Pseudomonas sp. TH41 TaxID=2796405 RepID=UPI001914A38A|nr:hypothetical protein [Pseudomonas sp. TH41]MBK5351604.1 hypothetical protein [Pseudomonas sp. TH41]
MDVRKHLLMLAIGVSASLNAFSAEKTIEVPADDESNYSIVSVEISGPERIAVIKKASRYSVAYTRSDYDCVRMTSHILASGSTLESLSISNPDKYVVPMSRGRAMQYIGPAVCQYEATPS